MPFTPSPTGPPGRGKKLLASPVKQLAEQHRIPVYQPLNFKTEVDQQQLADLKADLMIVVAYGLLLPKVILDAPRLGCINVHASLLPRWRGAAPIQRAIQAGDAQTGVTIMQMDEGLDTGAMLKKATTPISPQDTGGSLHDRLAEIGAQTLLDVLDQLADQAFTGEAQNDSLANYAHKLSKQEAHIDWACDHQSILNTIRAFNPWPVAFTEEKSERIRILQAETGEQSSSEPPGTIIARDKQGIEVQCGSGSLRLTQIQLPGAKAMHVRDFINGGKDFLQIGTQLVSR